MKMNSIILVSVFLAISSNIFLMCESVELIEINANESEQLRLKSTLSYISNNSDSLLSKLNSKRIIWSFKRIYFNLKTPLQPQLAKKPEVSNKFVSNNEIMISIDADVEEKLIGKYSIDDYDLVIRNLTYEDSGLFICKLWNQKQIVYQVIVNSASQKPTISSSLQTTEIVSNQETEQSLVSFNENDDIVVRCIVRNGYPFGEIAWFQNNIEILNANKTISLIDRETLTIESKLYLSKVGANLNENTFKCVVNQENRSNVDSNILKMDIKYKPIVFISFQVQNENTEERVATDNTRVQFYENMNKSVTFKCNYKANPKINEKITWLRNGAIVLNENFDENYFYDDLFVLKENDRRINNLTCQVKNSMGLSTQTIGISFMHEPKITIEKRYHEVNEDASLSINCNVASSPKADQIQWIRISDNQIVSNSPILDFKLIKRTDTGAYKCQARNNMIDSFNNRKQGLAELTISVNVLFKPIMSQFSIKQAARKNANVTKLICLTTSNPEPLFTWFREEPSLAKFIQIEETNLRFMINPIEYKKNFIYENILEIKPSETGAELGRYRCEVFNRVGRNSQIIELVDEQAPELPIEFRVSSTNYTKIGLSWQSGFNGGFEQQFEISYNSSVSEDPKRILVNDSYGVNELKIGSLDMNTAYSFRIRAFNTLGSTVWSTNVDARTMEINETTLNKFLPKLNKVSFNKNNLLIKYELNRDANSVDDETLNELNLCFKITYLVEEYNLYVKSNECLSFNLSNPSYLQLSKPLSIFNSNINNVKLSICLKSNLDLCGNELIAEKDLNLNNEDYLLLLATSSLNLNKLIKPPSNIPFTIIISICVCILVLFLLLLFTIIYCMRKRNLNLKNFLLNNLNNERKNFCNKLKQLDPQRRLSNMNKSFNVDVTSISAPINGTSSTVSTSSTSSTSSANYLYDDHLLKKNHKMIINSLQVTEDDDLMKQKSMNSNMNKVFEIKTINSAPMNLYLTAPQPHELNVNNLSEFDANALYSTVNIHHAHYEYGKSAYVDTAYTCPGSGSASGSNTDPIVVNNSIISSESSSGATTSSSTESTTNESTDSSPTYGYNVTNALKTNNLFVKTSNSSNQLKSNANVSSYMDAPESGYSTPSRLKKVFYEVIV